MADRKRVSKLAALARRNVVAQAEPAGRQAQGESEFAAPGAGQVPCAPQGAWARLRKGRALQEVSEQR
eukprot:5630307-Lingulodinium_polyedra.AAC.1